jgi:histidine triad (HIT) family protein
MSGDCIFCKIINREIPADIIFENDDVLAFRDLNPQASTHALIIPKKHIATINDIGPDDAELVGKLYLAAAEISAVEGISEQGYRVVMNCNEAAGQTVFHIHLHLLGGSDMGWPPWPAA